MSIAFFASLPAGVLIPKSLKNAKTLAHSLSRDEREPTSGVLTPPHSKSIVKLRWLMPRGGTRAVIRHESS